jgi:hypothetical protein
MNMISPKTQMSILVNHLNCKTHHSNSKVIPTKKRHNTYYYRIKLFQYNTILKELEQPITCDYLDNIDCYIEYSKKQTRRFTKRI